VACHQGFDHEELVESRHPLCWYAFNILREVLRDFKMTEKSREKEKGSFS
jgi:hypothetical protein